MNTHRRITTLGELVTSRAGKTPLTTNPAFWEGSVPWVTAKDLKQFRVKDSIDRITGAAVDDGAPMAVAGDVLILVRGMTLLNDVPIAICENPVSFNQDVRCLSAKPGVDSEYLALFLEASKGRIRNFISVAGHGTGRLDSEALMTLPIALLGKNSEARVARHFRAVERAIQHTDALIAATREQKRGLMQQLLTGKVRFPGFTEPWKTVRLGDVAHEVSERNKGQLAEQDVCGVIKGAGLMPMRERVMGDDLTRYLVVDPHSFAYNPMRLNIGSIAFNTSHRRVLVSPDYVVFATRSAQLRPEYLNHVRASWLWERFVQRAGSGSVRTRIYFDDLAQLKLPIPTPTEQDRINAVLQNHNAELRLLNQQREALATQRRGLMERLLSGDIALPSSDTSAA